MQEAPWRQGSCAQEVEGKVQVRPVKPGGQEQVAESLVAEERGRQMPPFWQRREQEALVSVDARSAQAIPGEVTNQTGGEETAE